MSTESKARTPAVDSQKTLLGVLIAVIRPYMPPLVPLVVYASFFPLVIFVSLGAGYFVWSNLSISWKAPLYLQYGDGVAPYAHVELPRLMLQQRYSISLDLQLPATEMNLALGNFMTSLTVLSPKNKTLAHVRRPAIVLEPLSSWPFRKPRSIHINVPLLDSFVPTSPNLVAAVEIGRADSWTTIGAGQGREVNVLLASLNGLAVPRGIRGLGIRFPLISSFGAAFIFFLILSLILAMWILPIVKPQDRTPRILPETKIKKERKRSVSATGVGRSRRRSTSSHREDRSMLKRDSSEITIPSAEESSKILRRRSSRLASSELET